MAVQLRVLSLNVWALAPPFSRHTALRMRAIGEALAVLEVDVVAFQELWHSPSRDLLLEASESAGLRHVSVHDGGLGVLSRFPIREARMHYFAARGIAERIFEADYLGHKGFVELQLETPLGPLAFFDTHLQAAYAPRESDPHIGTRVAQSLQLASRLRDIAAPVILAGDLNFEEEQIEYRLLRAVAGVEDGAVLLDRRQDTIVASNAYTRGDQRGERIDYLFCRSGAVNGVAPLSIERSLDTPLRFEDEPASYSDHAGVLAQFQLSAGGGSLPPVDQGVLREARPLLEAARRETETRRQRQRIEGSLGLAAFPALAMLANRPALSRRQWLRRALRVAGSLGGIGGLARLGLTESLRPEEAQGFDTALELLRSLGG